MKTNRIIKKLLTLLLVAATALAYMPFTAVPAYADDGDTVLTLKLAEPDKTEYQYGDPVNVIASGADGSDAWVGLYKKDEHTHPGEGGVNSLRWFYVRNHEGEEMDITADELWDVRHDKIGPGEYKVVLFGDGDYTDIRDTVYFKVVKQDNPDAKNELSLELVDAKESYMENESIFVKATGTASGAWVGLYKKGESRDPANGGAYSRRWFFTGEYNGEKVDLISSDFDQNNMGSVREGTYEVILFGDGGYDNVVKTIEVTVTPDPNREPAQPSDELTLKLADPEKTTYKLGEEVWIMATGSAEGAWVGLYKETETPQESVPSLRWYYLSDGYNGVKVDIMSADFIRNNQSPITEGEYKILLFDADNYDNCVAELHIKVEGIVDFNENDFTVETDKTEYQYKEDIKVRASGTGIGNSAWVGLYPADTIEYTGSYLYYYYVKDFNGVWTTIQKRVKGGAADKYLGDGKYKLVIFADGSYSYPVKSVEITVIRELKYRKVLRDPGCVTFGVEYVTYEDDTSEYREIPTLGGHLWGDPIKVEGKAVHKYVCSRNANHVKTEACKSSTTGKVIKAAKLDSPGTLQYACDVCGDKFTETIPALGEKPALLKTKFIYNGKTQKPGLTAIKDADGTAISKSMYTVTYPKKSYKAGKYTVTVKFKDRYSGTYKLTYKVVPKKVSIKTPARDIKSFTAKWSRAKAQTTGYQIAYATNKTFKSAKYKKVKGIKKTSAKIKKLKGDKKYYVKVRAYKVVKGKAYYSAWSAVKTVKTKK